MDNKLNFLIALFNTDSLIWVALKTNNDAMSDFAYQYPLEPESKKEFGKLLPKHIRDIGPIVEVRKIFDVVDRSWDDESTG